MLAFNTGGEETRQLVLKYFGVGSFDLLRPWIIATQHQGRTLEVFDYSSDLEACEKAAAVLAKARSKGEERSVSIFQCFPRWKLVLNLSTKSLSSANNL